MLGRIEVMQPLLAQVAVALEHARLLQQVQEAIGRQQSVSSRLLQVQEEERRFLAQELHDEVGQSLTGLKLILERDARASSVPLLDRDRVAVDLTSQLLILS